MPIDESRPFVPVRIAVLTVSDTRGPADDRSGDTLVERLESAGHILAARYIDIFHEAGIKGPQLDPIILYDHYCRLDTVYNQNFVHHF